MGPTPCARRLLVTGVSCGGLIIALLGGAAYLYWYAFGRQEYAEYVFPDRFRGPFVIIENQPDGVDIREARNRCVCRIPANGVLKLKGSDPLVEHWAQWQARYRSGKPPIVTDGTAGPTDLTVCGGSCATEHDQLGTLTYESYYLGTDAEYKRASNYDAAIQRMIAGAVRSP